MYVSNSNKNDNLNGTILIFRIYKFLHLAYEVILFGVKVNATVNLGRTSSSSS